MATARSSARSGEAIRQRLTTWIGTATAFCPATKFSLAAAAAAAGEPRSTDFDPAAPATWNDQTFRELDRNRDNRITSSEWLHSADYFRRADRNRDGALTLNEFTGAASSNPVDFASLDTDRSGTLTPNEWRWERRSFERYDTDDDGLLTRREFNEGGGAPAEAR